MYLIKKSIVLLVCATVWLKCTEFKKQNLFAFIFLFQFKWTVNLIWNLGWNFQKS